MLEFIGVHSYAHERTYLVPFALLRRLKIGPALATGSLVLLMDEPATVQNNPRQRRR